MLPLYHLCATYGAYKWWYLYQPGCYFIPLVVSRPDLLPLVDEYARAVVPLAARHSSL